MASAAVAAASVSVDGVFNQSVYLPDNAVMKGDYDYAGGNRRTGAL